MPSECRRRRFPQRDDFAPEGHGADRTFNRIGVELDAAIMEKAGQAFPSRERIADRLGERAAARDTKELLFEPSPECVDNRLRFALSCRKTIRRRLASNCGFNRIKLADPAQGFLGKRRIGRLRDLIELAPRVRPTRSKDDIALCQSASNFGSDAISMMFGIFIPRR